MYVHHSVHVSSPIEVVSRSLASAHQTWFPRLGDDDNAAVGVRIAGVGFRKKVALEFGEPVTSGAWTEVPITWQATGIKELFPVMVGKVELAPVDVGVTRLTVCGMYQPPLGRLGKKLDDALLHRVAEATVKELAETIAVRLAVQIGDGAVTAD